MIDKAKPLLSEAFIEHHGIKGMRWGVRRKSTSSSTDAEKAAASRKRKEAIGILAVGVGALYATSVLSKNGSASTTSLPRAPRPSINNDAWSKSVDSILKDMAQANHEQDQYMRSIGLGKVVNNRR